MRGEEAATFILVCVGHARQGDSKWHTLRSGPRAREIARITRKGRSRSSGTSVAYAARTMRHLVLLLVLVPVGALACGGQTDGPSSTASGEEAVLFPASKDGSYYVVAAKPDTGEVSAFGPALPVDARAMDWFNVHVSADGKRVAAIFTPKAAGGTSSGTDEVLVVGDGVAWKTIDHAPRVQLIDASDDLSLLAVGHDCPDPSAGETPLVLDADGKVLYGDASCASGPAASIAALAPDGSYFVSRGAYGDLTLHRRSGETVDVYSEASGDGGEGPIVLRAFPTSLLVGNGASEPVAWVDTDGKPVDVPGWAPASGTHVGADDIVVIGGVVYGLEDRALARLADVPPGVDDAAVTDVRDGLVVATAPANRYEVVDPKGAVVATYTPEPPSSSPPAIPAGTPSLNLAEWIESRSTHDAWFLFWTQYDATTAQDAVTYESADELWLFVDRGGAPVSRTIELRRGPVAAGQSDDAGRERAYAASSSGAFVLYADSGALHAVDVDTSADRALATDFIVDAAGGSILRHRAPRW